MSLKKNNYNTYLLFKIIIFLCLWLSISTENSFSYGGFPECSENLNLTARESCKDLIDLPLCNLFPEIERNPIDINDRPLHTSEKILINCVQECHEQIFNNPDPNLCIDPESGEEIADCQNLKRGIDYAVHGSDCIRFCPPSDNISQIANNYWENGEQIFSLDGAEPCIQKACHQLSKNDIPDPDNNCQLYQCQYLTLEELRDFNYDDESLDEENYVNKFIDSINNSTVAEISASNQGIESPEIEYKQYCIGDTKCYNFEIDELEFLKSNGSNPNSMCQIHQCAPILFEGGALASTCSLEDNDENNITNQGDNYTEKYTEYIDPFFGQNPLLQSNEQNQEGFSSCTPTLCQPIFYRQHRCLPDANSDLTQETEECDTACEEEYCKEKIDCNIDNNEPECQSTTEDDFNDNSQDSNFSTTQDDKNLRSWFYRPQPLSKVNTSNIRYYSNDICYETQDLENNDWGESVNLGIFTGFRSYYFHSGSRSPGHCRAPELGSIGAGYINLCGVDGLLYNEPNENVGYNEGSAQANYEGDNPYYQIKTCLRHKNAGRLDTCGKRECGIDCLFGQCTQWCGFDRCKVLTVYEEDIERCKSPGRLDFSDELVENDDGTVELSDNGCAQVTRDTEAASTQVRLRASVYGGRMICSFIDLKGTTAYPGQADYMGPDYQNDNAQYRQYTIYDKKLDRYYCVDGTFNDDLEEGEKQCEDGHNSNDDDARTDIWRAVMRIDHIGNNKVHGNEEYTYIDSNGKKHYHLDCAYLPLRIGPPRYYKIANIINSRNLFAPPLWLSAIKKMQGYEENSTNLKTDFHYPAIEIKFGEEDYQEGSIIKSTAILSLSKDETGYENFDETHSSKAILQNVVGAKDYYATVFIRKEFNELTNQPTLCAYQEIYQDGEKNDELINCINRTKPEISSTIIINDDSQQISIARKALVTSNYENITEDNITKIKSTLNLQLMTAQNDNNSNQCAGNNECSNQIIEFSDLTVSEPSCNNDIENFEFCAQREPCSELFAECIENEINLLGYNNSSNQGSIVYQDYCSNTLLKSCALKWGIEAGEIQDISQFINNFSQDSIKPSLAQDNAYGWFNEICITKGFEDSLKDVIAYNVDGFAITGKCVVDENRDGYDAQICQDGGNASKNCYCIEYSDNNTIASNQYVRKQTYREAGLCIDMPYPKICPAINYLDGFYSDSDDPYFVSSSISNSQNSAEYNNENGVHTSHQLRTTSTIYGHGEFNSTFGGVNNFKGSCNGFWQSNQNQNSWESTIPTMSCNSSGSWDINSLNNSCVRYSCPEKTASDMIHNENGEEIYPGDYALGESEDNQGNFNGYANWNQYNKTTDFLQTATADAINPCITGFKLNDNGYPTRICNQVGGWSEVTNACQRITCPAVNPPRNASNQAQYNEWMESGGAEFEQGLASRSKSRIIGAGSTVTGTCFNADDYQDDPNINPDIKFFQSPGGEQPSRTCNHNGQWGEVQNPCVTSCVAIDSSNEAEQENNGYAYWNDVNLDADEFEKEVEFNSNLGDGGCLDDYVQSPYSAKVDFEGNLINIDNIFNENNEPTIPTRKCISVNINNDGNNLSNVNIWGAVINSCVNYCPGYEDDARIGIGTTQHNSRSGTMNLQWPKTNLGDTAYVKSKDNINASDFEEGNISEYMLSRKCGADGKWEDPIISCSTHYGQVGNAYYGSTSDENSVLTASSANISDANNQITASACISNHGIADGSDNNFPIRECTFKDNNKYIDEVYLNIINNSEDCVPGCNVQNYSKYIGGHTQTYNGALTRINVGESIDLSCPDNRIYRRLWNGNTPTKDRPNSVATCSEAGTMLVTTIKYCTNYCSTNSKITWDADASHRHTVYRPIEVSNYISGTLYNDRNNIYNIIDSGEYMIYICKDTGYYHSDSYEKMPRVYCNGDGNLSTIDGSACKYSDDRDTSNNADGWPFIYKK